VKLHDLLSRVTHLDISMQRLLTNQLFKRSKIWVCGFLLITLTGCMPSNTPISRKDIQLVPTPPIVDIRCHELLSQGGFEMGLLGWEDLVPNQPIEYQPKYVTNVVFSGAMAVRIGIEESLNFPLVNGISQAVYLPESANTIILSFHYIPIHDLGPDNDLQFLDIIEPATGKQITRLWSQLDNQNSWDFVQFDLTFLRDRTVRLEFGVHNDGYGGNTALFLDEISLSACGSESEFVYNSTDFSPSLTATTQAIQSTVIIATALPLPTLPRPPVPTPYTLPISTPITESHSEKSSIPPSVQRIVIAEIVVANKGKSDSEEYIVLVNLSDTIDMDGWVILDEQNNKYIFHKFTFTAMSALRLNTGNGHDTQTDLFWGEVDSLWGKEEDIRVTLKDSTGTIIDRLIIAKPLPKDE
jgi:hypothetical protein